MAVENKTPGATDGIEEALAASRGQRMTPFQVGWMLCAAIRMPEVFAIALTQIDVAYFNNYEAHLVLLWRAAVATAKASGGSLPADPLGARELLTLKCGQEIGSDPDAVYYTSRVQALVLGSEPDEFSGTPAVKSLIDEVFDISPTENVAAAVDLLARFLRERIVSDALKRAIGGYGPQDTIEDTTTVLAAIEAANRRLIGMDYNPGSAAVIDGFVPWGRKAVTTKIKFLDRLMGGGHADAECYALLGPSSGGKSALGVQIAMEAAELEAATAAELGEEQARYWYYFTWELTTEQLRTRIYSYGARVDINSFNAFVAHNAPYSTSTRHDSLKPYESEPYVNSPGNPVLGETERLAAFNTRCTGIGANMIVVDYSADRPGHGDNSIDGVAAYLKNEVKTHGRKIGGIVIDYAKLVINRYIGARRLRPESEYGLLSQFGADVRSKISIPFKCKSWVLHQLHGSAAKKQFGKLHYSDALGCKNFADNFDFGIEFGMYNKTSGLVEFSSSKHRHAAGLHDGVVARFDGRLGVFMDPDQDYARDPSSGALVPRDFIDRAPVSRPTGSRKPPINPMEGFD